MYSKVIGTKYIVFFFFSDSKKNIIPVYISEKDILLEFSLQIA